MMSLNRTLYELQHRALAAVGSRATGLWHFALQAPQPMRAEEARRAIAAALERLFEDDWKNIEAGHYPASLALDFPFWDHLAAFPFALADGPRMLWKRFRQKYADLPRDEDLSKYPPYYRRAFHWQPDGWLSAHSAHVYDVEVEFLFWGAADIMRRMTLPALKRSLADKPAPRLLDIACGTARFLSTVHAVVPNAKLYGVDLSPYYVAQAHELVPQANVLVENAEELPFDDDSFDAAVSIFLFHELPHDARRNVMREAHRVLAGGGRFVICDSLQRHDAQALGLAAFSEWFPSAYHEPYYKGYLGDDLAVVLRECGFEVESASVHGVSKIVVARKV